MGRPHSAEKHDESIDGGGQRNDNYCPLVKGDLPGVYTTPNPKTEI